MAANMADIWSAQIVEVYEENWPVRRAASLRDLVIDASTTENATDDEMSTWAFEIDEQIQRLFVVHGGELLRRK